MKREKAETGVEGRWPPWGERSSERWDTARPSGAEEELTVVAVNPGCTFKTTDAQTPLKVRSSEALKVSLKAPRWLECEPETDSHLVRVPEAGGKKKAESSPALLTKTWVTARRWSQFTIEQIPYGSGVGERMFRDRSLSCSPTKKKTAL